jgi:3-oxoacyl-[acyl-carrier protein] reductase
MARPANVSSPFANQIALVTGTSRGLGRVIADRFLAQGATVVGVSRSTGAIEHERYIHVEADVTDEQASIAAVRAAFDIAKRIDVVVNNAGAASMNPVLLTPGSLVERLLRINYEATFWISREAARFMQRRSYGRIVNMSSVAVPMALEGEAAYAAAKSAIETFSRIFAREIARYGITCNVVAPAPVPTDLIRGVPAAAIDALTRRLALGRTCTPDEVAYAVEILAHPDAGAITGQVLYLGGPA